MQRTNQSNLNFQCKIHEKRVDLKQGGWSIFTIQPSGLRNPSMLFYDAEDIVAHGDVVKNPKKIPY